MKLTVKTLKGGKFNIECEPSKTVSEVKGLIEKEKAELPAAGMKLIHSGKVLKDDVKIEDCGIKDSDFLVVMVTKPKKAAGPAPAAAAAPTPAEPKTPAPAPPAAAPAATAASSSTETPAASSSTDTPSAPARPSADNFSDEIVSNLTVMGFPEDSVRHCLRAANGNPDVAMEFLTNGIPPAVEAAAAAGASSPAAGSGSSSSSGGSGGGALQSLRSHPQFNQLRRLVQTNPQMLQTVLTQIGQQQPELLQEINANQGAFLAMMNEPIEDAPAPAGGGTSGTTSGGSGSSSGSGGAGGLGAAGMLEGMANPAQMAQMIQNMSSQELNQMAQMMGLSADQLRQTAQMLGQIPPEQLQQYMMQAMGGAGGEGMTGLMGGGGGGGPQVLRLNEEEMAAVDRLTEMGFDRAEAAQAFLACDKNEALAANLLMDSMGDGGGGWGGDAGSGGNENNNNGGGGGNNNDDDDDAMYD